MYKHISVPTTSQYYMYVSGDRSCRFTRTVFTDTDLADGSRGASITHTLSFLPTLQHQQSMLYCMLSLIAYIQHFTSANLHRSQMLHVQVVSNSTPIRTFRVEHVQRVHQKPDEYTILWYRPSVNTWCKNASNFQSQVDLPSNMMIAVTMVVFSSPQ